jgi:hypothetical protein
LAVRLELTVRRITAVVLWTIQRYIWNSIQWLAATKVGIISILSINWLRIRNTAKWLCLRLAWAAKLTTVLNWSYKRTYMAIVLKQASNLLLFVRQKCIFVVIFKH